MKKKHISFEELITDAASPIPRVTAEEAADMIQSDQITEYDRKLISSTVAELVHTAIMFKNIRERPKITIFGSARTAPDHPDYIICRDFARRMTKLGYMVITGAGPGIMAAGHEGAGRSNSIGVSVELPFEAGVNEFVEQSDYLITYRYFFNRKLAFIREADAVVLCPGGFGTMDEAFEVMTLLHTGRSMPVPLVLLDHPGSTYWDDWLEFIKKTLLEPGHISQKDMYLFRRFQDIDEAADYIYNFYRRYHSMRYIGDKVVLRLNTPVPRKLLDDLREEYAEFLGDFGIQTYDEALPEEHDEPDLLNLPRLVIKANRKHPVEMYLFIRSLNRELIPSSTRRQDRPELQQNPRPKRVKVTSEKGKAKAKK